MKINNLKTKWIKFPVELEYIDREINRIILNSKYYYHIIEIPEYSQSSLKWWFLIVFLLNV